MASNKFDTVESVKQSAQNLVQNTQKETERQNSIFEEILNQVGQVNPELGNFEELAILLQLSDEHFSLIAPVFLDELEKALNNIDDKMMLAQSFNISGAKLEDVREAYDAIFDKLDTEFTNILSTPKRTFLKRMLNITFNVVAEAQGVAKRIIQIPLELEGGAKVPTYGSIDAAALDLYAPEEYTINPGETVLIPVNIKVAIPKGYAFLIHPRSGTSLKSKLRIANSIGLIDSDYRGTIGVIVENIEPKIKDIEYKFDENGNPIIQSILHGSSYTIGKGERFAQMRLVEVPKACFFKVDNLETTERGAGGFGSTGIN